MKEDIYIVLLNKVRNKYLAYWGAILIYTGLCLIYIFHKFIQCAKKIELPPLETAEEEIRSTWPEKDLKYQLHNERVSPLVDLSIIIPVYNSESMVKKCIVSILKQETKYKYEVIIVDDGSNAATKRVLQKFKLDPKVIIISQDNHGISNARNVGLNHAVGKYVMFVDCDDTIRSDCVQKMVESAEQKKSDIVISAYNLIKEDGGVIKNIRRYIYPAGNFMNYCAKERIMNYPGLPWGKIYRRDLFKKIRFPENYWYEDTIIQFLVFRSANSYCYLPETLYNYYWYEENYSKVQAKVTNRLMEHYWIVVKMIQLNDQIGLPRDSTLYTTTLRHFGNYLYHDISKLDIDKQKDVFVLAYAILHEIKPKEKVHLNFQMRELEKVFQYKRFSNWKYASELL